MNWQNILKLAPTYTLSNGTTVKLPKGLRISHTSLNRTVEAIHVIVKKYGSVSPRAIVGYLYDVPVGKDKSDVPGTTRRRAVPEKSQILTYLKMNPNVYNSGAKTGEYKVR